MTEAWRRAYEAWIGAVEVRDRVVARAEQQLLSATGGLGLYRWELACRRARVNTAAEAGAVARAVRAEPAVRAAGQQLDALGDVHEAAVLAARSALADRSEQLLSYGSIAATSSGLDEVVLRRLARRPARRRPIGDGRRGDNPVDRGSDRPDRVP